MIRAGRLPKMLSEIALVSLVFLAFFEGMGSNHADAAISGITTSGSAVSNSNGTTLSVSPSANLTVGKVIFVSSVSDNNQTTDGASTFHSISDTDGHTWTKITEYTETDGAANDGVTVSLYATKVTTQIDTTDSITLTLGASKSDKIITVFEATFDSGMTFASAQTGVGQNSLTAAVSSLTSREYLLIGVGGSEGEDSAKTASTNYTERFDAITSTSGNLDVNAAIHVQTRIATLTSDSITSSAWTFTNAMQTLSAIYQVSQPTLSISQPDGTSDTVTVGDSYNVTYTLADSDSVVTAAFYYDSNNSGYDGTAISGACASAAEGSGATCSWDTTGMTPGSYYVYGVVDDGSGPIKAYSSGQITINAGNAVPTISISLPNNETVNEGVQYEITYTLSDTDNVVTAAFYYDTNSSGLDGTAITGECATAAEGTSVSCTWDTAGMSLSTFYVYGITNDGSGNVSAYSPGTITFQNEVPVASALSIDSGASSVTLTEGTTKSVVCSGTVTDGNGYADITSVSADLYRTSRTISSPLDDNDHYQLSGDSQCIPSGGSGNSETYTCTFAVQYFADPTDTGSPNASDNWTCMMIPTDGAGGTGGSDTIEMDSLIALNVTSSISYGSLSPNTDTGSTNQQVTVTNTGNRDMDPQLSGTNMTLGGNSITVSQQKYSGSTFTYSSGGTALSTTPTALNLTLPQRTSTEITAAIYWGIGVPDGTVQGNYAGTNTFTASAGI